MTEKMTDLIAELLDNARNDYRTRQEAIGSLEELDRLLDDPLLVNNKDSAAAVCDLLITTLIGGGVVHEQSIMHRLGLRLLDYIKRD
jgi:hypothetical protein